MGHEVTVEIVLKEDLNVARRYVRGATVDFDRPSITQISKQLQRTDWYEPKADVQRRMDAAVLEQSSARKGKGK